MHAGPAPTLKIEVDARDLPRRLLHSRIQRSLPAGQAQALVSQMGARHARAIRTGPERRRACEFKTSEGKTLKWQRDELEPYRVECDVPEGVREVTVLLDTICNEPADRRLRLSDLRQQPGRDLQLGHVRDVSRRIPLR